MQLLEPLSKGKTGIKHLCAQAAEDYYDDSRPALFDHVDDAINAGGGAETIYASITTIPKDGCISTVEFVTGMV